MNNDKPAADDITETMTHIAWALQHRRVRRTIYVVPLEIGYGRIEPDGTPHLFLDREPKSGYGGSFAQIKLLPRGVNPQMTTTAPRPGDDQDDATEQS
jgi:hypothetical protein